jgi:Na+/melibiose symporter-like transporter
MSFLKSLGVWSLFTCGPVLVMILPTGRINSDQGLVVLLFFLVALIGAILLQRLGASLKSVKWIVLCGLSLGIALPALGGLLLWIVTPGFESGVILVGALAMAIPSSIGGALAGWIQGRSDAADREREAGDQQGLDK